MFVPEGYENYKYLVDYSDNYIVLTDVHSANGSFDNPVEYDTIIQYFKPSTYTIESSSISRSSRQFEEVAVDSDFYSRADSPTLILDIYISIFFVIFLINGLTRFVRKGGIFFG